MMLNIHHQPYMTIVQKPKSWLLKTLLSSLYAFTHRVLLQTSMHPKSTGENDISSPLYKGVSAILSLFPSVKVSQL